MAVVLDIIVPVFGLIMAGFLLGRPPWFPSNLSISLSSFVLNLGLPALLFSAMASRDLPGRGDLAIIGTYFLALLAVAGLALASARLLYAESLAGAATLALGATFSNFGLIGIPLVLAAFGHEGLQQMLLIVTFHSVLMIGSATLLAETDQAESGSGSLSIARTTVLSLLTNPVIMSIMAGIAYGALGLGLPRPVDRTLAMLSAAVLPCALFALGSGLRELRLHDLLGRTTLMVLGKLVVLPLAVWVLGRYVFHLGPLQLAVAVTCGSLPNGINVYLFAQRYGVHVQRTASAVLLSTAFSAGTTTLVLAWLRPPA